MGVAERSQAGERNAVRPLAAVLVVLGCGFGCAALAQRVDAPSGLPTLRTDIPDERRADEKEPFQRRKEITPSISAQLLWTDNVIPQTEDKRSDFVLTVTPRIAIAHDADRARLHGSIALPFVLYAETSSQNALYPEADLVGQIEVIDNFFFVEAAANVRTDFLDPFGPRPAGVETVVRDRVTTQSYSVSPFIEGRGGLIRYSLRDDNLWTKFDDAPSSTRDIYTNRLTGLVERDPTPFGWGFDLSRTVYEFEEPSPTQTLELARARAIWQPTPQLRAQLSGGYERNELAVSKTEGAIYGAGLRWQPSERTVVSANWEHRFFGGSYDFLFEHRMPRSSFSVEASRTLTSYPEQIASIPAGGFVPSVLNAIFASRIPDPAQRQQYIQQFIVARSLPLVASEPVSVYAQQVYLAESARATAGLIGVRNNVFLAVYYYKTTPVEEELDGIPADVLGRSRTKQIGATASWNSQLSSLTTLTVLGNANRAEARPTFNATSDTWTVEARLTRALSPKTTAYAGTRYESFRSDVERDYTATSVFVGASHLFN